MISKACVREHAFTLIEILVVISIFAVIGLVTSQAVVTTLRGSRKAENQARLRQNVDYALGIIERNLHNGSNVTCPNTYTINYVDPDGNPQWFAHVGLASDPDVFIAHSNINNRITSNEVRVNQFVATCTPGSGNTPGTVDLTIRATDPNASGPEDASVSSQIKVVLRRNI